MTRKTFTSEETTILRTSPAVIRTTSRRITYASWFRRYADIFRGVGLDPGILGTKRIERCMNRWRTEYAGTEFGPHEVDGLLGHAGGSDAEGLLESLDRMNDQLDRVAACVNVVIAHTRDVIDGMDATRNAMTAAKRQSARLRDAIQTDRR